MNAALLLAHRSRYIRSALGLAVRDFFEDLLAAEAALNECEVAGAPEDFWGLYDDDDDDDEDEEDNHGTTQ